MKIKLSDQKGNHVAWLVTSDVSSRPPLIVVYKDRAFMLEKWADEICEYQEEWALFFPKGV